MVVTAGQDVTVGQEESDGTLLQLKLMRTSFKNKESLSLEGLMTASLKFRLFQFLKPHM